MLKSSPKTVAEMVETLRSHGVPDWMYVIDKISGDEVYGIAENERKEWTTYYCERGKMNDVKVWSSEAEAVHELFSLVKEISKYRKYWQD